MRIRMHLKTTSLCAYTFCHYSPHRQLTSVWTLSVISYRFNPLSHACADRHLPDCEHIMGVLPLPSSLPSQGRRRSLKRRIISKAGFFFHGVAMSSLIFLRQIELGSSHEEVCSSVAPHPLGLSQSFHTASTLSVMPVQTGISLIVNILWEHCLC